MESLITVIGKKNGHPFAYPILAAAIFLILGFSYGIWAYAWIIFLPLRCIILYFLIATINMRKICNKNAEIKYHLSKI